MHPLRSPNQTHRVVPRARGGWRRSFLAPSLLAVVLTGGPVLAEPAPPTTDPAGDARAQREQTEAEKQKVDRQLGELTKTDVELKAELTRLEARQKELEAAAAEARTQHDNALADIERLKGEVAEAERQAAESRQKAAERAVAAYMRPERESATEMLAARDPQQLGRMRVLIGEVAAYDHDVMLDREAAEQLLRLRNEQAKEAQRRADEAAAAADRDLAELGSVRQQRETVKAELELRIVDLRSEAEALNAQEAELTSLIAQQEAQARAAAATSTTTTTAAPTTTTTTAPPPTTTRPGQTTTSTTRTTVATTVPPPTTTTTVVGGPGRGSLSWPVSGVLTSPFGPRWGTIHKGIDVAAPMGTPIRAAANGVVFFSGEMSGYGNVILIDHGNGTVTLYAHQSQLIAGKGAQVARGQNIGLVGSTGHSTGPHLHFEVRINGVAVDPVPYLG